MKCALFFEGIRKRPHHLTFLLETLVFIGVSESDLFDKHLPVGIASKQRVFRMVK
jgi:hypothetical protein